MSYQKTPVVTACIFTESRRFPPNKESEVMKLIIVKINFFFMEISLYIIFFQPKQIDRFRIGFQSLPPDSRASPHRPERG